MEKRRKSTQGLNGDTKLLVEFNYTGMTAEWDSIDVLKVEECGYDCNYDRGGGSLHSVCSLPTAPKRPLESKPEPKPEPRTAETRIKQELPEDDFSFEQEDEGDVKKPDESLLNHNARLDAFAYHLLNELHESGKKNQAVRNLYLPRKDEFLDCRHATQNEPLHETTGDL